MCIFDETKTIALEPEAIEIIKQALEIYLNSHHDRGTSKEMMAIDDEYAKSILLRL